MSLILLSIILSCRPQAKAVEPWRDSIATWFASYRRWKGHK